jgi:hypothetical protein
VRWRATGLPEEALVRVVYRIDDGAWTTAPGADFVPGSSSGFSWELGRREAKGALRVGLVYLAPHEPRTWRVDHRTTKLADVAPNVRPGDVVELGAGYAEGGVTLPGAVVLRAAEGATVSITIAAPAMECVRIAGVPGDARPSRVSGIAFRTRDKAERGRVTAGLRILGGAAEVDACTFERNLAAGVEVGGGAAVALRECRMDNAEGAGVIVKAGSSAVVTGGVMAGQWCGVWAEANARVEVVGVTVEGARSDGVRIGNGASATVRRCRIRSEGDGVSASDAKAVVVEDCTITAKAIGIRASASEATIARNKVDGASIGVQAVGVVTVTGNELEGIRDWGVDIRTGTIEVTGNRIRLTARGAGYAPPQWAPYWSVGATGIIAGLGGASGNPTISGNTFAGYDRYAVVLGWGQKAILADNTFARDEKDAVLHSDGPYERGQMDDGDRWKRAREAWESAHPEDRKKR